MEDFGPKFYLPASLTTAEMNAVAQYRGAYNSQRFDIHAPMTLQLIGFSAQPEKVDGRLHGGYTFHILDTPANGFFKVHDFNHLPGIDETDLTPEEPAIPEQPEQHEQPEPLEETENAIDTPE